MFKKISNGRMSKKRHIQGEGGLLLCFFFCILHNTTERSLGFLLRCEILPHRSCGLPSAVGVVRWKWLWEGD